MPDTDPSFTIIPFLPNPPSITCKIAHPLSQSFFSAIDDPTTLSALLSTVKESAKELTGDVTAVLSSFLSAVRADCPRELSHMHLEVRTSRPNSMWDIPRWHYDGSYWPSQTHLTCQKYATVLCGAGTMFLERTEESVAVVEGKKSCLNALRERKAEGTADKEFMEWFDAEHLKDRKEAAEKLKNYPVTQPKVGEMARWTWGREAAIHSEPKIGEHRVLLVVIPGTREQVEERELTIGRDREERERMIAERRGKKQ